MSAIDVVDWAVAASTVSLAVIAWAVAALVVAFVVRYTLDQFGRW